MGKVKKTRKHHHHTKAQLQRHDTVNSRHQQLLNEISPAASSLEADLGSLDEKKRIKACDLLGELCSRNARNLNSLKAITNVNMLAKLSMRLADHSMEVRARAAAALSHISSTNFPEIFQLIASRGLIRSAISLTMEAADSHKESETAHALFCELLQVVSNAVASTDPAVNSIGVREVLEFENGKLVQFFIAYLAMNCEEGIVVGSVEHQAVSSDGGKQEEGSASVRTQATMVTMMCILSNLASSGLERASVVLRESECVECVVSLVETLEAALHRYTADTDVALSLDTSTNLPHHLQPPQSLQRNDGSEMRTAVAAGAVTVGAWRVLLLTAYDLLLALCCCSIDVHDSVPSDGVPSRDSPAALKSARKKLKGANPAPSVVSEGMGAASFHLQRFRVPGFLRAINSILVSATSDAARALEPVIGCAPASAEAAVGMTVEGDVVLASAAPTLDPTASSINSNSNNDDRAAEEAEDKTDAETSVDANLEVCEQLRLSSDVFVALAASLDRWATTFRLPASRSNSMGEVEDEDVLECLPKDEAISESALLAAARHRDIPTTTAITAANPIDVPSPLVPLGGAYGLALRAEKPASVIDCLYLFSSSNSVGSSSINSSIATGGSESEALLQRSTEAMRKTREILGKLLTPKPMQVRKRRGDSGGKRRRKQVLERAEAIAIANASAANEVNVSGVGGSTIISEDQKLDARACWGGNIGEDQEIEGEIEGEDESEDMRLITQVSGSAVECFEMLLSQASFFETALRICVTCYLAFPSRIIDLAVDVDFLCELAAFCVDALDNSTSSPKPSGGTEVKEPVWFFSSDTSEAHYVELLVELSAKLVQIVGSIIPKVAYNAIRISSFWDSAGSGSSGSSGKASKKKRKIAENSLQSIAVRYLPARDASGIVSAESDVDRDGVRGDYHGSSSGYSGSESGTLENVLCLGRGIFLGDATLRSLCLLLIRASSLPHLEVAVAAILAIGALGRYSGNLPVDVPPPTPLSATSTETSTSTTTSTTTVTAAATAIYAQSSISIESLNNAAAAAASTTIAAPPAGGDVSSGTLHVRVFRLPASYNALLTNALLKRLGNSAGYASLVRFEEGAQNKDKSSSSSGGGASSGGSEGGEKRGMTSYARRRNWRRKQRMLKMNEKAKQQQQQQQLNEEQFDEEGGAMKVEGEGEKERENAEDKDQEEEGEEDEETAKRGGELNVLRSTMIISDGCLNSLIDLHSSDDTDYLRAYQKLHCSEIMLRACAGSPREGEGEEREEGFKGSAEAHRKHQEQQQQRGQSFRSLVYRHMYALDEEDAAKFSETMENVENFVAYKQNFVA